MAAKKIYLDNIQNTLLLKESDVDGIEIIEEDNGGRVYVYYSEIDLLKEKLDEVKSWRVHV